jgi:phospholipid/cholesterol/gamma-HCH transport system substrate-binding protein
MNERVMQFRIGMFVIVAGLVLTMLIVWFGESPQILREQGYIKVHYAEAPGVLQGVAVRKSGIRVGEVVAIDFDDRPNQPDGVLVTVALERKFKIREGSVPRLTRSLIGDVTIDLLPGEGTELLQTASTPAAAPIIEGDVTADPSKALAAATKAFERAGSTLATIEEAASGLAKLSQSAKKLDDFLATWDETGKNVSGAAKGIRGFIGDNEGDFKTTMANLQKVADKLNNTLDEETQDALKTGVARFSAASARLDAAIADVQPLMKDLGSPVSKTPATDVGQAVRRLNRIASDVELLSAVLRNRQGTLNTNGAVQKLLTQSELYDNFNTVAVSANQTLNQLKLVLASFRSFAEKVSSDPGAISRGVLNR